MIFFLNQFFKYFAIPSDRNTWIEKRDFVIYYVANAYKLLIAHVTLISWLFTNIFSCSILKIDQGQLHMTSYLAVLS